MLQYYNIGICNFEKGEGGGNRREALPLEPRSGSILIAVGFNPRREKTPPSSLLIPNYQTARLYQVRK